MWNQSSLSDQAMISLMLDFETIKMGSGLFNCFSELHLDVNDQNIIHSTIKQQIIKCQLELETKQELINALEAKLSAELTLASIWQNPSIVGVEDVQRFLLDRINKLAQELPKITSLVLMVTEVN